MREPLRICGGIPHNRRCDNAHLRLRPFQGYGIAALGIYLILSEVLLRETRWKVDFRFPAQCVRRWRNGHAAACSQPKLERRRQETPSNENRLERKRSPGPPFAVSGVRDFIPPSPLHY